MTKRRTRLGLIIIAALILTALFGSIAYADTTKRIEDSAIHSNGQILFDNGTADTSDDVIFDADDLKAIADGINANKTEIDETTQQITDLKAACQ